MVVGRLQVCLLRAVVESHDIGSESDVYAKIYVRMLLPESGSG